MQTLYLIPSPFLDELGVACFIINRTWWSVDGDRDSRKTFIQMGHRWLKRKLYMHSYYMQLYTYTEHEDKIMAPGKALTVTWEEMYYLVCPVMLMEAVYMWCSDYQPAGNWSKHPKHPQYSTEIRIPLVSQTMNILYPKPWMCLTRQALRYESMYNQNAFCGCTHPVSNYIHPHQNRCRPTHSCRTIWKSKRLNA